MQRSESSAQINECPMSPKECVFGDVFTSVAILHPGNWVRRCRSVK